jgi:hypothetical protein
VRLISYKGGKVAWWHSCPEIRVETRGTGWAEYAFQDTAAVLEGVRSGDFVRAGIVAHLAGALAVQHESTILKQVPGWRWLMDRTGWSLVSSNCGSFGERAVKANCLP